MSKLGRPTDKMPEVRPDKATEIMASYRESCSSLPKMDELALDFQTCEAMKISQLPLLEPKTNSWTMIYRKMIEQEEYNLRFVVTLLRRDQGEGSAEDHNIKLTLFEIVSGRQDVFVYTEKDVLSEDQINELAKSPNQIKTIFKNAVDTRLRIK